MNKEGLFPSIFQISAIFFLVLMLSGCDDDPAPRRYRIGFSQCTTGDVWRKTMHEEMKRELSFHPELELLPIRDARNSSEKQIEQIRQLVAEGIDLLLVSPNEAQPITPVIEEVFSQGIPVILIDRKTNSNLYTAFIGADNYEIGHLAGRYIANLLEGRGKIIEVTGLPGSSPAIDRQIGFRDAIEGYPEIEVAKAINGQWEAEFVLKELPPVLREHPDIDLIYSHNDRMAMGAYRVARHSGLEKSIYFVGVDGLPSPNGGMQLVEDGILDATILYPTGGQEAIQIAVNILRNYSFDKENKLQTTVIDARNVHIIRMQSNKLLNQQENIERQQEMIKDLRKVFHNQKVFSYIILSSFIITLIMGTWLYKSLKEGKEVNKRLENKNREILEQRNQIKEMSEKALEATKAKFQFFTNISHEFRTPLTLILGTLESLLSSGVIRKKESRQDLSLVQKNALRLLRLVNQLMEFRKIENNKMTIRASENDLLTFVRDIMKAYEKVGQKRNIDFRLFTRESTLTVWFDVNMMDKVLFNLLSNAFKFTEDGGKIHIAVERDTFNNWAKIIVEDNGRGMSREHVEHAFEPFYQGEKYRAQGTGLGLSLSKELVSLHQGEITLMSVEGKGTRFEIRLPFGKDHFKEEQILIEQWERGFAIGGEEVDIFIEEEEEEVSNFSLSSDKEKEYTLLIIEDNNDFRNFLKGKLATAFNIMEAADGRAGLEQAVEQVPDLIVCDIMLPEKDGLDLVRVLKADLRTSHIPIILLTAKSSVKQKIEGLQTGADAYITKPFNLSFLAETIRNLLKNREALKERFTGTFVSDKKHTGLHKLDQRFIKQFTTFVEQHYSHHDFTLEDLSLEFGLSRVQLYRKVKALFGQGVNDYIQNFRLTRASQLLLEDELSISEVAYQVGYSSPSYFSTAFKTKFHCSPSEFKNRHLQKQKGLS